MNKKSNVIVGAGVVGVIGLGILGMSMLSGSGQGNDPVQAMKVAESEVKESVEGVAKTEPVVGTLSSGSFVASKQGKKYFPVDCGSVKTIKEENKLYFGSEAEAIAAGYERTLTCK